MAAFRTGDRDGEEFLQERLIQALPHYLSLCFELERIHDLIFDTDTVQNLLQL
jgi:hypothetical protein